MILRVNAVYAIIVFFFFFALDLSARDFGDFVPSVLLACQELGNVYIHFT